MTLEIVSFPGGPVATNAYLVADADTGDALVIDAPQGVADAIAAEAARRGWTIRQVVITHTHWDHVADAGLSSGSSATRQSVVRISEATEAAFCRAVRVTLVGSSTPSSTMSP